MQLVRIYCGLDTNGHDVNAKAYFHNLAAKYFPNGHTVYEANGRWNGEVGVIDEPTLILEVMYSDADSSANCAHKAVNNFAGDYKFFTYQESVLITWQKVDSAFI